MERLTKIINGYAHGAEGVSIDKLTGNYCRGEFEATAIVKRLAVYEEIGTVKECMSAMEKQKAKKPILCNEQAVRYALQYNCPSCGGGFAGTGMADYCYHCGQKLDWGSEGE